MSNDPRVKRWKHLLTTDLPVQFRSLDIVGSDVFGQQTVRFERVTAVTGMHGTGKSLLLRTIEALFGHVTPISSPPYIRDTEGPYEDRVRKIGGVFEATMKVPNGSVRRRVDISLPGDKRLAIWNDAKMPSGRPLTDDWWPYYCGPVLAFAELASLEDHSRAETELEHCERVQLSSEDLRGLKQILGKEYDRVTIYTVPTDLDEGGFDYPIPLVFATREGEMIDSTRMSAGELWVHYLFWFLRQAAKGLFVLVDEPEAFISARGHRALIDEVARYCLRSELQVLVATHSPEILSRFPLSHIRMCAGPIGRISIIEPSSLVQLRDAVGVATPVNGIVLVEDILAMRVLRTIIGHFDVSLVRELEIVPADGQANVIAGLRSMREARRLAVLGVLDGDQRKGAPPMAQLFFLPGVRTPEDELLSLTGERLSKLSTLLGRPGVDVSVALANLAPLDHQYRIGRLAEELSLPEPFVLHALTAAWLSDPVTNTAANELVDNISSTVRGGQR